MNRDDQTRGAGWRRLGLWDLTALLALGLGPWLFFMALRDHYLGRWGVAAQGTVVEKDSYLGGGRVRHWKYRVRYQFVTRQSKVIEGSDSELSEKEWEKLRLAGAVTVLYEPRWPALNRAVRHLDWFSTAFLIALGWISIVYAIRILRIDKELLKRLFSLDA